MATTARFMVQRTCCGLLLLLFSYGCCLATGHVMDMSSVPSPCQLSLVEGAVNAASSEQGEGASVVLTAETHQGRQT